MKCSHSLALGILFSLVRILHAQEEKSIGALKAEIAVADRELNQVYQKAKSTLPESIFVELQEEQRTWIAYRDTRSEELARFNEGVEEGKEKLSSTYWESVLSETASRIDTIKGWMDRDKFAHEWEGVWSDGQGGWLFILQNEPGRFTFLIDVVRGPTFHLGSLDGVAEWKGRTARFTIRDDGAEEETWLTFINGDIKLEVIGENTSYYHGARAYFGGNYLRLRELNDEDRKRLLSAESL